MTAPSPYTPELQQRFAAAIAEIVAMRGNQTVRAIAQAALQVFASHGIGLVEIARATFLIDLAVHEGVLWRLERAEQRAGLRKPAVEMTAGDLGLAISEGVQCAT